LEDLSFIHTTQVCFTQVQVISLICTSTEAEFLDNSLKSFPPCFSQSPLLKDFTPRGKNGLKLVCNVNIVRIWKPQENSQDLVQKPSSKLYVHEFYDPALDTYDWHGTYIYNLVYTE
jgi:hypothetical protein